LGQAWSVKLRYTLLALADLESVLDYIAQRSPQGARRVQSPTQTVIAALLQHPHIGTRTSDPTIRRMTALPYPYLIFNEAADEEIIIHSIRHAARNPSDMPGPGN
jgi:toxin ParE1/3/4